jgi:hypothetical protein
MYKAMRYHLTENENAWRVTAEGTLTRIAMMLLHFITRRAGWPDGICSLWLAAV